MQILVHLDDGFWIVCNTYPDCVHGQLLKKWDKTYSVPKTRPELKVCRSFNRFPYKDFIAFFGIVFPVKCRSIDDIGIYLWLENKNERQTATSKHAEKLLIFVDNCILRRKCCPLQSFSLLGWFVDGYLHNVRPVMLSSRFYPSQENL